MWTAIGNGCSFYTCCPILCLQVEPNDDNAGNVASDISENSHNVVYSGIPAVKQVRNFISNNSVTQNILGVFSYFISYGTLLVAQFTKSGNTVKYL